jgi:hypothetical protein
MDERLHILELIEAGEISVEEGARRLEALARPSEPSEPPPALAGSIARPAWGSWLWQPVFWTGAAFAAGGGLLAALAYTGQIAGGWQIGGWLLFFLGVLGLILGWWLQRAPWFYLRVRQRDGHHVNLALPLPLGFVAWGLRVARPFVPHLEHTGVDEMILAMRDEMQNGRPFVVEVDERAGTEQVQVYFG